MPDEEVPEQEAAEIAAPEPDETTAGPEAVAPEEEPAAQDETTAGPEAAAPEDVAALEDAVFEEPPLEVEPEDSLAYKTNVDHGSHTQTASATPATTHTSTGSHTFTNGAATPGV